MSRKHNSKHPERKRSNYPARLSARGLSKAPALAAVEGLRNRQLRRVRETCTIGPNHEGHECNGFPFPRPSELNGDVLSVVAA